MSRETPRTDTLLRGAFGASLLAVGFTVLTAFALLAEPARAAAGDVASTEVLPIAVNVEGQKVRSSMYLELPVERYDAASLVELREKQLDPVEQSYLRLLEALRAGDATKAGASLVGGAVDGVSQRVELLRSAFGGMDAVRSIARLDLGAHQLFVWDWSSPRGPQRRGFAFDVASRRGDLVSSTRPLETLLVDILQNQVESPDAFDSVDSSETRFAYRLPLEGAEVVWHFDGEALDFDLYDGGTPPTIPALQVLYDAHAALAAGDVDGYLDAHTSASRAKLAGWIDKMPPEEFLSFQTTTLLGKRVRFVLDADPVFLVFYHFDLGPESAQQPRLAWLYVVRDPASGRLLLANAYREAFLDDFLKDESLIPRDPAVFARQVLGLDG
ncbi:MAG: hypothetical protein AAGC60_25000 [Acidobacteriota bacterium]